MTASKPIARPKRARRVRVIKRIEALSDNPRPPGVQKLAGTEDDYRIRVGDYRVVYEIRDALLVVLIMKVAHRRQVYG